MDVCNIQDGSIYVCTNPEDYESAVFADTYVKVGYSYLNMAGSSASGFITKMGYDPEHPYCNLPYKAEGGSTSTYYCDKTSNSSEGIGVLVISGCRYMSEVGLSSWRIQDFEAEMGCRLSYKPV